KQREDRQTNGEQDGPRTACMVAPPGPDKECERLREDPFWLIGGSLNRIAGLAGSLALVFVVASVTVLVMPPAGMPAIPPALALAIPPTGALRIMQVVTHRVSA
ncbi:MAG: hypothetical protein JSV33_09580, partial [bacterium]